MVAAAGGEQTADKLVALVLVAHYPANGLWIKVAAVVVGEHRQHGHSCLSHLAQGFVIDARLEAVGGGVDEEPFRNDHVELLHSPFQRCQRVCIPVDIPCRAHTDTRVAPFVDELLGDLVAVTDEAVVAAVVVHIVVVHAALKELVAQSLVRLRCLVVLHERL